MAWPPTGGARLTTPYGTTAFRHEADPQDGLWARMIEATDALGQTEHLHMEWQTASMSVTLPASEVPTGFEGKNQLIDHFKRSTGARPPGRPARTTSRRR